MRRTYANAARNLPYIDSALITSLVQLGPFEGQALAVRPRPRDHFGDLGGARFTGDHRQIRDPHQHLKIGSHNVKMRRPMIVGVHAHTHGIKAVGSRHPWASISVQHCTFWGVAVQGLSRQPMIVPR